MGLVLEVRPLTAETKKLVGTDGGSSEGIYEEELLGQIARCRKMAEASYTRAIYAHALNKNKLAQEYAKEALSAISEAFWRAEATSYENDQHDFLHRIAKWKHDNLGCYLEKAGKNYVQRCSVALTHKRMGFSAGFTGDSVCAICKKDEFECAHMRGRTYWVLGGLNGGECRVCGRQNCSQHDDQHIYRVSHSIRIRNPILHEVSMVKKPAIPTARLTEIPVSRHEIEEAVGIIDESKGMVYSCHKCGGECPGFTEFNF